MKRVVLVLIFLAIRFTNLIAQEEGRWLVGVGIGYDNFTNTLGLNGNLTYRMIGNFHVGPDFSTFLNNTVDENGKSVVRKEFEFNFNAQQLFEVSDQVSLYPLAGINWSKVTEHLDGSAPNERWVTAANLGGGCELKLKRHKLFSEYKFVTSLNKWDVTLGFLYRL